MVAYNKYHTAIQKLCDKLIDAFGTTDTWNVAIHTDAPVQATDSTLSDLTQLTGTGYTAGGSNATFNSTRTGDTVTATAVDVVWNAGGAWPAAQYVSLIDVTATNAVWCWWDYGSTFTLASGETFTVDFGASLWTMT